MFIVLKQLQLEWRAGVKPVGKSSSKGQEYPFLDDFTRTPPSQAREGPFLQVPLLRCAQPAHIPAWSVST